MGIDELKKKVVELEYNEIVEALKKTRFNKMKAAELMGIDRKTLYNKIDKYEKLIGNAATEINNS